MKKILGAATLAALALTACGVEEAPRIVVPEIDPAEVESEAKAATINKLSADKEEAKIFLKQMQEKDPAFVDAYYAINEDGKKVMMLVRDAGGGNVVTYPAFDAASVPTSSGSSGGQSATDGSGSSIMPALLGGMLAGAVMGSLANNAMQGTTRSRSAQEEEKRRSYSGYSGYVASQAQTTARQNATARAVTRANAASAARSSSTPAANSTASSSTARSGAFGSSGGGARAGGYAGSSGG